MIVTCRKLLIEVFIKIEESNFKQLDSEPVESFSLTDVMTIDNI